MLGDTMRFYRVSRQNAWTTNNAVRRGSVEVYVAKPLNLYTGENWQSLFFIPDTATVAYVFNTNILPSANNFAEATKISWFEPTAGGTTNQSGLATAVVWLANSGNWIWHTGGTGTANSKLVPVNQGFLLEIPGIASTGQPVAYRLMVIGRVPTQQVEHTISGKVTGGPVTNNVIHILSHTIPVRTAITNMGILNSGFVGGINVGKSDEVRILRAGGSGSLEQPDARLWYKTSAPAGWYDAVTGTGASTYEIDPDDAVIIVRRNTGTMIWTNRVLYSPPTKNFTP
jgi:hypothetical protein